MSDHLPPGRNPLGGYQGKRVAVTGVSGFLGGHLARLLMEKGAEVVGFDRRAPGSNLQGLDWKARFVDLDLADSNAAARAIAQAECELVFHLAAYAVHSRDRDIRLAIAVNVAGSAAVVEGAARGGASTLIQLGTSHEYGGDPEPISENHPICPTGLYGATKAAGMVVGRACARDAGLSWVGLRPFVTYGPGEDESKLIPYVITQALKRQPVITTTGEQIRDLLYVDDLVEAIALCGVSQTAMNEIVNIGSGIGVSVATVVNRIAGMFPDIELSFGGKSHRPDEVQNQVADTSKLRSCLCGWKPKTSLESGLKRTIDWYQSRHQDIQR